MMFDWSQVFGRRQKTRRDGIEEYIDTHEKMKEFTKRMKKELKGTRHEVCDQFASYVAHRVPKAKVIELDSRKIEGIDDPRFRHWFIEFKEKYYDFWNPKGVDDWRNLSWLQGIYTTEFMKRLTIKNEEIVRRR